MENKALITERAEIISKQGFEIKIGKSSIVHPQAKINALNGPIIIGERNLIEERSVIINENKEVMIIGDDNVFEVGCEIKARMVGSNCIFGIKSRIGAAVSVEDGVVLASKCEVDSKIVDSKTVPTTIKECTSVFGEKSEHWRVVKQIPTSQSQQIDYLKNVLPKYSAFKNVGPAPKSGNY